MVWGPYSDIPGLTLGPSEWQGSPVVEKSPWVAAGSLGCSGVPGVMGVGPWVVESPRGAVVSLGWQ